MLRTVVCPAACITAFVAALGGATSVAASEAIHLVDPPARAWEETPEGVAFAPLTGDRFAEAYAAMVRLPAGTVSPPHVKSANMFGIMITGEMEHVAADTAAAATRIGPGGYYMIPAGLAHVSRCVSAVPCVTFLYQDGAFDFQPVTP